MVEPLPDIQKAQGSILAPTPNKNVDLYWKDPTDHSKANQRPPPTLSQKTEVFELPVFQQG